MPTKQNNSAPERNNWTAETVKEELPDVQVEIYDKVYVGSVLGRKNDFATIWPVGTDYEFQYAWETLANILNLNKPLRPCGLG